MYERGREREGDVCMRQMFDCAANWRGCGLAFERSHLLPGFVCFIFLFREVGGASGALLAWVVG